MAVLVIVDKKGLGNLSKAINVALCGIIWSPVVSGKRKQEGFEGSGAHDFPERPNVVQRLHVCPQRPTATISLTTITKLCVFRHSVCLKSGLCVPCCLLSFPTLVAAAAQ